LTKNKKWTKEEDKKLIVASEEYKGNWEKVA
jgi:hypothetical protein